MYLAGILCLCCTFYCLPDSLDIISMDAAGRAIFLCFTIIEKYISIRRAEKFRKMECDIDDGAFSSGSKSSVKYDSNAADVINGIKICVFNDIDSIGCNRNI